MFCKNCGEAINDNQAICLKCGVKKGDGNSFCANCGKSIDPNASVCLNCGVAVKKAGGMDGELGNYNKWIIALVCFLIGGLGIHNFMLGETKKGVLRLILTILCAGLGGIIALVDFIRILIGNYEVNPDKFF